MDNPTVSEPGNFRSSTFAPTASGKASKSAVNNEFNADSKSSKVDSTVGKSAKTTAYERDFRAANDIEIAPAPSIEQIQTDSPTFTPSYVPTSWFPTLNPTLDNPTISDPGNFRSSTSLPTVDGKTSKNGVVGDAESKSSKTSETNDSKSSKTSVINGDNTIAGKTSKVSGDLNDSKSAKKIEAIEWTRATPYRAFNQDTESNGLLRKKQSTPASAKKAKNGKELESKTGKEPKQPKGKSEQVAYIHECGQISHSSKPRAQRAKAT